MNSKKMFAAVFAALLLATSAGNVYTLADSNVNEAFDGEDKSVFLHVNVLSEQDGSDIEKTEEKTIYLSSDKGNDQNNGEDVSTPVATLPKAIELLGADGGNIKIVGTYDHATGFGEKENRGHITLSGYDGTSTFVYSKTWALGGDTTIENINWKVNANSIYILAMGHTIEIGMGVTVTKGENVGCYMSIRGGGDTNEINGDTHIILCSGTFFHIAGGTANRNVNGNTLIEIYGGTFVNGVQGGNNSYIKDSPGEITGNTTIKIYGGDFTNCTNLSGSDGSDNAKVLGTRTLDLRKFDGEISGDIINNFDKVLFPTEKIDYETDTEAKYITGYDNGDGTYSFKPDGKITRAEAVTIISRLLKGASKQTGLLSDYADVTEDKWYYNAVAVLENSGYLEHFEGEFAADKNITRAEFVEILFNMGKGTFKNVEFSDIDEKHELFDSVRWAASNGVVNGYENQDGTYSFKPDGEITRAEAVTVINRFLGRKEVKAEKYSFTDIGEHWAAAQIEASAYPEKAGKSVTVKSEMDLLDGSATEFINYAKAQTSTDKVYEAIEYGAEKLEDSIRNTESEYTLGTDGRIWYVSPNGDDKNDGLSPEKAKKTLGHIGAEDGKLKAGDVVLFERGGEWRGQKLWTKPGVTYSAYGEGAKPILNRSPLNGADASLWTLADGTSNIWKYNGNIMDCGTLVINGGEYLAFKHTPTFIGGKYFVKNSSTEFNPKTHLTKNLDFVQLDYTKVGTTPSIEQTDCYGTLYLRSDNGNPGEIFDSVEFAVRDHAIVCMSGVTIDNLDIRNTGAHGISSGNCPNLTVRNCVFEHIGGGIQGYSNGFPTLFGNAVEIWGSSENFNVYNNYINQVYDAAITNQYKSAEDGEIAFKNSRFFGNVIKNTKYPIELFLTKNSKDNTYSIENMTIENNFFLDIGKGLPQHATDGTTAAGIKCAGADNPSNGYDIKNNVFFKSTSGLFEINAAKPEWLGKLSGNIYVQTFGAKLGIYNNVNYAYDYNAEKSFDTIGENGEVIVFVK